MNVAVIGTGYVGLVNGTCLAETGNQVICVDIDEKKVENMKNGKIMGHTDNYIHVQIDGDPELVNTIKSVKLTLNHGAVVDGEL